MNFDPLDSDFSKEKKRRLYVNAMRKKAYK